MSTAARYGNKLVDRVQQVASLAIAPFACESESNRLELMRSRRDSQSDCGRKALSSRECAHRADRPDQVIEGLACVLTCSVTHRPRRTEVANKAIEKGEREMIDFKVEPFAAEI